MLGGARTQTRKPPMRSAICIAAGRSATPAAATLHSVLSTYVEIRPKMAEKGDKNDPKMACFWNNFETDFLYSPSPRRI